MILAAKMGTLSEGAVKELLNSGANPFLRDSSGRNALDWAREKERDNLVKVMRQARYHGPATI